MATRLPGLHARSQRIANDLSSRSSDNTILTQVTFATAAFLAQDMSTKGLTVLGFAGSGHLEPLLHSFMGLLFGHDKPFFNVSARSPLFDVLIPETRRTGKETRSIARWACVNPARAPGISGIGCNR